MNRLLIVKSVLVGAQMLAGGAAVADVLGPQWAGLVVLAVAAAQAAIAAYEHGLKKPVPDSETVGAGR